MKNKIKVQTDSLYGEINSDQFKLSNDYVTRAVNLINQFGIDITEFEVRNRYSERQRHFHTTEHLDDVLSQIFDINFDNEEYLFSMIIAGIFHDIVYDPRRKDNEEKSIELLETYIGIYDDTNTDGFNNIIDKSEEIILATKNHDNKNKLCTIFNKIDCSVLDKHYQDLLIYEEQIRKEYTFVDYENYKPERIKFLKSVISEHPDNIENLNKLIEYIENK